MFRKWLCFPCGCVVFRKKNLNFNTAKALPEDPLIIYACRHSFWCLVLRICCYNKSLFFSVFHNVLPIPKPNTSLPSDVLFCCVLSAPQSFLSLPLPSTFFTLVCPFPSHSSTLALLSSLVENEEEMKIRLLQRKRNQLSGYCKLVIYGVLELSAATDVFKHYSKVEMERRALRDS